MKKQLLVLLVAAMAIAVNLNSQTIVLSESFEHGIPVGWTQESVMGNQTWVTEAVVPGGSLLYPEGAVSGLGRAVLRNTTGESKGYKTRLITPVMNLDTVFQPILRYYHAQMKWTADFDTLRVLYRVSETSNWVLLQEFTQPIQMWTKELVELPRVSKTYQVCFEGSENMGRGIVLDSVVIRSKPECTIPHDMTVTNMHKNEVTLNWLASFDAVNFQVLLAKTDNIFDIEDTDIEAAKASGLIVKDTTVSGWQTYVALTGLESKTNYVAFVRSLCENENSDWGSFQFYMKAIEGLPYSENFNIAASSTVGQHKDWTYGTDLSITAPYINANQSASTAANFARSGYALCFAGKTTPGSGANIAANSFAYAATPMIDVDDISTCQVRFWASLGNYGSYKTNARAILVGVMDDPDDISTFVAVDTVKLWRYATYEQFIVNLASYQGEGRYVAFVSRFDMPNQFYIDDLTIELSPDVPTVADIRVAPLATGVDLTWGNVASAYNVLISTEQVDDASTIAAAKRVVETKVSAAAYTVSGLAEGTQYYAYVQAEGGAWSAAKGFTTSYKQTLPMKFGFETAEGTITIGTSTTKYPKYVGVYSTASTLPKFYTSTSSVHSGSQALYYDCEVGRDAWITFPVQDSAVQTLQIEFYMRAYNTSYKNTEVTVGVMTDPADLTTFVPVESFANATATYMLCYTDFLSYTGNGKYIAIRWTENEAGGATSATYMKSYPVLDDVEIDVLSGCVMPKLGVKDITASTATLEWTARNMLMFDILVDTKGDQTENDLTTAFNNQTGVVYTTTIIPEVNQLTLPADKLHWGRTYYAYIRSACDAGEHSYWTRAVAFTLATPEAIPLPYVEDFDYYGSGAGTMAAGWDMISTDAYPQLSTSAKYNSANGNYAGVYMKSAGSERAGKLFAPVLDADDLGKVKVSFWAKKGDSVSGNDSLRIGVTDQADTNAVITWLDTIAIPKTDRFDPYFSVNPQWTAAMGKRFVFQQYCYNGATTRYIYMDDIAFESIIDIAPFGFKTNDAADNSVTISWQGESANGWKLWVTTEEIDTENLDKVDASKIVIKDSTITSNPLTIKGLKAQTGYYVYLRALNGTNWSEGYNAWTQCVKLVPNSANSRMDFEGYLPTTADISTYAKSTFPECWTRHGGDEAKTSPSYVPFICTHKAGTTVPGNYAYSGLASAKLYANSSAGGPAWFATPEVNAKNMANVTVSFYAKCGDSSLKELLVGVMKDPDDWGTFTPLYTYQPTDKLQWYQVECNFGTCGYKEGMGTYIAFSTPAALVSPEASSYQIDEIDISESACPKAYPTLSRLTDNSVRLMYASQMMDVRLILTKDLAIYADSLNSETLGTTYLANLLKSDAVVRDTVIRNNVGMLLNNLEGNTPYYLALQTLCADENALWSVTSFQTLCTPLTAGEMGVITFEEGFSPDASAASSEPHVVPCWTVGKKGIRNYLYVPYVGTGASAPDGKAFLRFRTGDVPAENGGYAIMPAVNVDSITRLQISFLGRATTTYSFTTAITTPSALGDCAGSIIVGVVTDPSDIGTFVAVDTVKYGDNAVHHAIVRFNKYRGDANGTFGKHVAFLSEFNQDNYFLVDNIQFDTITACGEPIALNVHSITDNSAIASWKGINTTYRVMVTTRELTSSFWETNQNFVLNDTVQGQSHTLTRLDGNTTYYVYVKALCDDADGEWCLEGASFTTECPETTTLPYKDNFDRYTSGSKYYPACWHRFYSGNMDDDASYPCIYSTAKYGTDGNGLQWKLTSTTATEDKRSTAATLPISGNISATTVSFKLRSASSVSNPNAILVGYATDVTTLDSLLQTVQYVDTIYAPASSTEWIEYSRNMEDCNGENVHIVLSMFRNGSTTTDLYMDDFKVEKTPTCYVPKAEVDSIGAEEVKLTIHPHFATDHAWDAMIISADYADTVQAYSADTTFIVKGLKPSTEYNLFVRTNCGAGDVSEWGDEAVAFRTLFRIGAGTYYSFEEEDGEEERVSYSWSTSTTSKYYIHPSFYAYGQVANYWPTQANGSTVAHTGTQALRFYHFNNTSAPTLVALPEIVGSDSLQIRFDMRAAEVAASATAKIDRTKTWPFAELEIGLIDANHDLESFQPLATYKTTDYEDTEKVTVAKNALFDQVVFPLPTGIKDKFIAFVAKQPISLKLYIDNLYIEKKQGYQTPIIGQTFITPTSLTLNWDANGSTKWNVYLTTSADVFPISSAAEADIVAKQTVTANTATFEGLTPGTKYFAFVQVADVEGFGATSARRTFVTPADVKVATSDTISFEDKDTETTRLVVPQNWYVGNDASTVVLQQPGALLNNYNATSASASTGVVVARTGNRALQLYNAYGNHLGAYAAMPVLNADYDTLQVNFYARPFFQKTDGKVSTSYNNRPLVVGTMTDPNNPTTFMPIDSFYYANAEVSTSDLAKNLTDSGWEKFAFRLKGRQGTYVAFSAPIAGQWYIDDITFSERTCLKPNRLRATDITGHSATLSWNAADEDIPCILQVSSTTAFGTTDLLFVDTLSTPSAVVTGLQGTTTYYYRVRQICSLPDEWAIAQSFTTECAEITGGYTNSFENVDEHIEVPGSLMGYQVPRCWTPGLTPEGTAWSNTPYIQESSATSYYSHNTLNTNLSNMYSLYMHGNWAKNITPSTQNNYYDQWIAMPILDNVDLDTLQLSFYALPGAYNPTTGSIAKRATLNTVVVGVMSDPNDLSTFIDLDTCTYSRDLTGAIATAANEYMAQRFEVPLAGMKGKGNYIAFRTNTQEWMAAHPEYDKTTINAALYIDDIALEHINNCPMPTDLAASDITLTSATLSWSGEEGARFVVNVSADPAFSNAEASVLQNEVVATNSIVVTGLDTATTYYWSVATQCTSTMLSPVAMEQFKTLLVPMFDEMFIEEVNMPTAWSEDGTRAKDVFAGAPMSKRITSATKNHNWCRVSNEDNAAIEGPHILAPMNSSYGATSPYAVAKYVWLLTPAIVLNDVQDAWLTFNAALTYFDSADAPETTGWDDQFMVVISDDGGKTWKKENATVWNNETTDDDTDAHFVYGKGDFVLNQLPVRSAKDEPITIDLTQYKGKTIKVGFYAESSVQNAYNGLHFGNVHINYFVKKEDAQTACQFEDIESMGLFHIDGDNVTEGENFFTKVALATAEIATTIDTLYSLTATYNMAPQVVINQTICEGESVGVEWGFEDRAESGTYKRKGVSLVTGCDSITTLNLTVIPRQYSTIEETICSGTSFEFNGKSYSKTGVYTDTLSSVVTGCDSIAKLILTVNPPITATVDAYACVGHPYYFTPRYPALTLSGTYMDTVKTVEGCDSIVTLRLTVAESIDVPVYDTVCKGQSIMFEGQEYTQAGTYPVRLESAFGCDSIRTLYLAVAPVYSDTIVATICPGHSYQEHGFNVSEAGMYSITETSRFGCDSVIWLDLSFYDTDTMRVDTTIQLTDLPYFYPNTQITYPLSTTPGTYVDTIFVPGTGVQCDHILIHSLTVEGGQGLQDVVFGTVTLHPSLIAVGESVAATGDFLGQSIDIQIYDMVGHRIKREQQNGRNIRIDGFYVAGLYTIQITDENGNRYMGRVIVK